MREIDEQRKSQGGAFYIDLIFLLQLIIVFDTFHFMFETPPGNRARFEIIDQTYGAENRPMR